MERGTSRATPPSGKRRWQRLYLPIACALLLAGGCGSTKQLAEQQQKTLASLKSTVTAICKAWLDENVSTTYARTALDATAALLEKERAKIGGSPDALTDPTIAAVSESQNQLARQIGSLRQAFANSDASTIRQLMAAVDPQLPRQP